MAATKAATSKLDARNRGASGHWTIRLTFWTPIGSKSAVPSAMPTGMTSRRRRGLPSQHSDSSKLPRDRADRAECHDHCDQIITDILPPRVRLPLHSTEIASGSHTAAGCQGAPPQVESQAADQSLHAGPRRPTQNVRCLEPMQLATQRLQHHYVYLRPLPGPRRDSRKRP